MAVYGSWGVDSGRLKPHPSFDRIREKYNLSPLPKCGPFDDILAGYKIAPEVTCVAPDGSIRFADSDAARPKPPQDVNKRDRAECILKNLRGVQSDSAAVLIRNACTDLHPKPTSR